MFSFVKKCLYCALLVGGLSVIGAGVANAAEAPDTSGASGILSGTQAVLDAAIPVTVAGNAISVIGDSNSSDTATAPTAAGTNPATPDGATTDGSDSTLGGTQAVVDAALPVTVTGNAISVIGDSGSADTSTAPAAPTTATPDGATTDGSDSILGGTQAVVDAPAPVTVTGNAISVIGDSNSSDTTTAPAAPTTATPDGATTDGSDSTLGGTQAVGDAPAPVTVTGNAISVIGDSGATGSTSTVPGTSVNPAGPTTPVNPVNPVTPITPVTPVNSVNPINADGTVFPAQTGTNSAAAPARTASSTVAGFLPTALASTGANPALLLGFALVPVVAGALLLILLAGLRRRQSLTA